MNCHYKYTDKEINAILKTLTIVMDTREKASAHITDYLNQKGVPLKIQKLNHGDYSCMVPKNEELGIFRDIYLNSFIERKNGIDEITGNLQRDTQQAFINELIRAQDSKFVLFVEEPDFDERIAKGMYRSKYDPKALKGRLESLKAKYNFEIVPMSKNMIGHNIYHRFYYQAKHYLRTGIF
ncbi:ERCC4 domain-containing protein [Bacillus mycoides]|uniref:ERCC4 domain-containing protein n=1 Tax=Bacillus mycoides TaxID=1405 RepID=UPI0011A96625|nr:ERCC4 domain-containing protein [Bacillus mycoides]